MNKPSVLQADRIETLVQAYGNMLFRLCLITLGNASDAEDVGIVIRKWRILRWEKLY